MTQRPPAFQFFARDWLIDEQVMFLSYESKGAYIDLLAHAWLEGSIPADLAKVGIILRDREVADRVWPELAQFWAPHPTLPGRLVNRRQEDERQALEEHQRRQSEHGRAGNQKRWSERQAGAKASPPDASGDRHPIPLAIAKTSPPDTSGDRDPMGLAIAKPSPTHRSASASASASEFPPTPQGGEGPSSAKPDPVQNPNTQPPDPDPALAELVEALRKVGYRSKSPAFVVPGRAKALAGEGCTAKAVLDLESLAKSKSNSGPPGGLLAHWLDNGLWREVLDEDALKRKEAGARARAEAAKPKDILDELVQGVYGSEPRPVHELRIVGGT